MNTLVIFMKDGSVEHRPTSYSSTTEAYESLIHNVTIDRNEIAVIKILDKDGNIIREN